MFLLRRSVSNPRFCFHPFPLSLAGTTLSSCHRCWYRAIPEKGHQGNGKEANGEEEQGQAFHQGGFLQRYLRKFRQETEVEREGDSWEGAIQKGMRVAKRWGILELVSGWYAEGLAAGQPKGMVDSGYCFDKKGEVLEQLKV